jgi:hypothetical protein
MRGYQWNDDLPVVLPSQEQGTTDLQREAGYDVIPQPAESLRPAPQNASE